jgi:hypothetical protein
MTICGSFIEPPISGRREILASHGFRLEALTWNFKVAAGDESGKWENVAGSHVNWILALCDEEWVWEHSGAQIKECWK